MLEVIGDTLDVDAFDWIVDVIAEYLFAGGRWSAGTDSECAFVAQFGEIIALSGLAG